MLRPGWREQLKVSCPPGVAPPPPGPGTATGAAGPSLAALNGTKGLPWFVASGVSAQPSLQPLRFRVCNKMAAYYVSEPLFHVLM